jgi:hypothetical protein
MKATRVAGTIVLMLFTFFASVTPVALCSIQGDLDGNGVVDMQDLVILIEAFGAYPGHPRWNDEADLNGDGKVDIVDAALLLTNLGKTAPTEVINVKISFNPHALNLESHGKWLKCIIEIPKGYDVGDLDLSTIRLNNTVGIDFNAPIIAINRGCEEDSQVMVRFNRAEVIELIKNALEETRDTKENCGKINIRYVTLTVTGKLSSTTSFEGKRRILTIFPNINGEDSAATIAIPRTFRR